MIQKHLVTGRSVITEPVTTIVADIMFITGRRELGLVVKMEKGNTASINGTRGGVVHAEVTSKHTSETGLYIVYWTFKW